MKISPLKWDSQFFEMQIGKVEIDELDQKSLEELKEAKLSKGFDLIYLILNTPVRKSDSDDLFLVDEKVTFYKQVVAYNNFPSEIIKEYKGDLTPELLQLAIEREILL